MSSKFFAEPTAIVADASARESQPFTLHDWLRSDREREGGLAAAAYLSVYDDGRAAATVVTAGSDDVTEVSLDDGEQLSVFLTRFMGRPGRIVVNDHDTAGKVNPPQPPGPKPTDLRVFARLDAVLRVAALPITSERGGTRDLKQGRRL